MTPPLIRRRPQSSFGLIGADASESFPQKWSRPLHAPLSFLYRGQTRRYQPCHAVLMRGGPAIPEPVEGTMPKPGASELKFRMQYALAQVRLAELELLMRTHPLTEIAARYGLQVDYEALGQHYGLHTDLLDLTSNVEVAAFFAVAGWSQECNWFIPMTSGNGVFYRVHWLRTRERSRYFDCVGHGPGTRPAGQHAWAFRLKRGAEFEAVPIVEKFEFRHDMGASQEVMNMFANGKSSIRASASLTLWVNFAACRS
jgi:hypothetical protein